MINNDISSEHITWENFLDYIADYKKNNLLLRKAFINSTDKEKITFPTGMNNYSQWQAVYLNTLLADYISTHPSEEKNQAYCQQKIASNSSNEHACQQKFMAVRTSIKIQDLIEKYPPLPNKATYTAKLNQLLTEIATLATPDVLIDKQVEFAVIKNEIAQEKLIYQLSQYEKSYQEKYAKLLQHEKAQFDSIEIVSQRIKAAQFFLKSHPESSVEAMKNVMKKYDLNHVSKSSMAQEIIKLNQSFSEKLLRSAGQVKISNEIQQQLKIRAKNTHDLAWQDFLEFIADNLPNLDKNKPKAELAKKMQDIEMQMNRKLEQQQLTALYVQYLQTRGADRSIADKITRILPNKMLCQAIIIRAQLVNNLNALSHNNANPKIIAQLEATANFIAGLSEEDFLEKIQENPLAHQVLHNHQAREKIQALRKNITSSLKQAPNTIDNLQALQEKYKALDPVIYPQVAEKIKVLNELIKACHLDENVPFDSSLLQEKIKAFSEINIFSDKVEVSDDEASKNDTLLYLEEANIDFMEDMSSANLLHQEKIDRKNFADIMENELQEYTLWLQAAAEKLSHNNTEDSIELVIKFADHRDQIQKLMDEKDIPIALKIDRVESTCGNFSKQLTDIKLDNRAKIVAKEFFNDHLLPFLNKLSDWLALSKKAVPVKTNISENHYEGLLEKNKSMTNLHKHILDKRNAKPTHTPKAGPPFKNN